MNPHHCEELKSHTKITKNRNVDGKVTLGKLNYRTAVCIVTVFNITYIFHHCEHCHILRLNTLYIASQKLRKKNNFQYKYTFYDQDHIC